jgi:hypothetical protein
MAMRAVFLKTTRNYAEAPGLVEFMAENVEIVAYALERARILP